MIQIVIWWLVIQILGWTALPLAFRMLCWLPGRGYAFAKPLGLLLASYLLWLGASTGLLRNDLGGILASILLVAGLSGWVYFRAQDRDGVPLRQALPAFLRQRRNLVITVEVLFTLAFLAWALLRAYAPQKIMEAGGEKFMEIAFLNGILNSPRFPPLDPWLSGFSISYYYFGYVMMAFMTRLSGAAPGVAFDLYDALLFALAVVGVFGVVYELVAGSVQADRMVRSPGDGQAVRVGLFGALIVIVMGNLEGLLDSVHSAGLLSQNFWQWLGIPGLAQSIPNGSWLPAGSFWDFPWRASRVIQDVDLLRQPVGASPITEFPIFSFLLGDNHPHVLALPFVLLGIALGLNLLRMQLKHLPAAFSNLDRWNPIAFAFGGDWALFLFYALSLGSLGFLNTWDMPIYIGLVALAYGAGAYAIHHRLDWDLIRRVLVLAAGLLAAAILLYILFYVSFNSQAQGILPYVYPPTRLPQYLIIFGIFIFITAGFLVASLAASPREDGSQSLPGEILRLWFWTALACLVVYALLLAAVVLGAAGSQLLNPASFNAGLQAALGNLSLGSAIQTVLLDRLANPWLFLLLTFLIALALTGLFRRGHAPAHEPEFGEAVSATPSGSDLFVYLLIFVGIVLTFSTEFFYLRDSFGVRMNTVFKLYYQGWVMLGCASAYGLWWMLNHKWRFPARLAIGIFNTLGILLILAGIIYPITAGYIRVNGFKSAPNLNGASEVASAHPDDWAAIQWLLSQIRGNPGSIPVILEAPGDSYRYASRVSAFSGLPTVLGWQGHESQWRGSYIEQGKRLPDIETIYTTADGQATLDLLRKWQIQYVIVGSVERSYIQILCTDRTRNCNIARAIHKFDTVLKPIFQQGETIVYEVPGI